MSIKYGCIGEVLGHSFSKEIHNLLADYEYELLEIGREELGAFMKAHSFKAINVTIPYKEAVMPYLDYIDGAAREIGAVNTVVNQNGALYGYNTDFYGMEMLLAHAGVNLSGKKVVILGTGGTSKTAMAVAKHEGAREIIRVSRSSKEDAISYGELYSLHTDAEIIINTTPVGMYPNTASSPIEIERFQKLSGVIDAVYNPLRTTLIEAARKKGIPAEGGLYMLVAQGVRASEIFLDVKYRDTELERIYRALHKDKENIVLTGMPASGKSTVGKLLSKLYNRELIDTDTLIEEKTGKKIAEIFASEGEAKFRELECRTIAEISAKLGVIIATGGGAVLREENVKNLEKNGRIYFIDRPLESLIPTADRPLSSDRESIEKRYRERYELYRTTATAVIDADCNMAEVAEKIRRDFDK